MCFGFRTRWYAVSDETVMEAIRSLHNKCVPRLMRDRSPDLMILSFPRTNHGALLCLTASGVETPAISIRESVKAVEKNGSRISYRT